MMGVRDGGESDGGWRRVCDGGRGTVGGEEWEMVDCDGMHVYNVNTQAVQLSNQQYCTQFITKTAHAYSNCSW